MQKVRELILEVYHYEKKTEIETRYLSNVLLWFALMVFLINLFNNSMEKNPGNLYFLSCGLCDRRVKRWRTLMPGITASITRYFTGPFFC